MFTNKVQSAFDKVLSVVNEEFISAEKMLNGVCSEVYLLNNKYIVKFNDSAVLESEYLFFKTNNHKFNEQIVFYDKDDSFIVYKYIKHDKDIDDGVLNLEFIAKMKDYIYSYVNAEIDGYGFVLDKQKSWVGFFENELKNRKHFALSVLSEDEYLKVEKSLNVIEKYSINKALLHGDFGVHNILFNNNQVVGVIDPETMLGDRIYDFITLIFSDVRLCKDLDINDVYLFLDNEPFEKVKAMIILVLFDRIIRCVRHNIPDIDIYISLWNYYANMI